MNNSIANTADNIGGNATNNLVISFNMVEETEEALTVIENPYMELNKANPALQFLKDLKQTDILNSYQYGKFYCPELYGFKSLRPFRNYGGEIEEDKEVEDKETESIKKGKHKYLSLEGLKPFTRGKDPIEFVQKFLIAYQRANRYVNKKVIHATFKKLLPSDLSDLCDIDKEKQDPDDLIETFVLSQANLYHLGKNLINTLTEVGIYYLFVDRRTTALIFQETAEWIATGTRIRYLKLLRNVPNITGEEFGEATMKSRFDSTFDIKKEILDFARTDILIRNKWLEAHPDQMEKIVNFASITTEDLQQHLNVSKYTDSSFEEVSKLLDKLRDQIGMKPIITIEEFEHNNKQDIPSDKPTLGTAVNQPIKLGNLDASYGQSMTEEEWLKDTTIRNRARILTGLRFKKNPYTHNKVYKETQKTWTKEAFIYINKHNRCRICGHNREDRFHRCEIDFAVHKYRMGLIHPDK